MVHPAGLEPATNWFEASYSNPLSYGCTFGHVLVYHLIREVEEIYKRHENYEFRAGESAAAAIL